ncbi:hypothetical protein H072_4159 [Dactylellina haptotyla CBS 200.50]|uniref:TeaA receptor TeaR n=1 Tax=Dactylellina haptotyla (strain CBS 200.50) TaxID=1284197 RepID=S8ALC1_DACHA|nr:hypothetical protein H072_4159 [Dactylellina haptotyla CBS 200.50]
MTSITASRGIANITPPSSSHGQRDWDYSVPIDTPDDDGSTYYNYTNGNRNGSSSRSRASSATAKGKSSMENRKPSYTRSNSDYTKDTPRNQNLYSSVDVPNDEFLTAPRAPALINRGNSGAGGSSDGRDSVIDMYSNNRLSTISHATDILPNINSSATAMYDLSGDIDNREASSWIHRDKLMRIESVEFKKSPSSSSEAWVKTASRKMSMDQMAKVTRGSTWENNSYRHGTEDEPNEAFDNNEFDLRLPEEREAEREAERVAQRLAAARNKSNTPSKIPVNIASPAPIPLQFLERNSPLKRARSDSLEDEVQSISYPATRSRSRTLESGEQPPVTPPEKTVPTSSSSVTPPSKMVTRTVSKNSPRRPSSSHRTSGAGGKTKPRVASSSAGNRGSGGNSNNAAKFNAPEGPPPWATGYTTDPKLPPDQQIIPTVAKRLQQEQWERENAPASVFDRELRPLKLHDLNGEPKEAINFGEQSAQWPMTNEKQKDPPPMIEPPKHQIAPPRVPSKEPIRVKDPEELPSRHKKDKGCCGCTIM